jgi:hypothetical protein
MKQEAIDRKVDVLQKFGSFQQMAKYVLGMEMEWAKTNAQAVWLDSLAVLLRDGEGERTEKELHAEYQEELKRIKERYHG